MPKNLFLFPASLLMLIMLPNITLAKWGNNISIGHVFGKTIYKLEIRHGSSNTLTSELNKRIIEPVLTHYQSEYKTLFEPRSYEVQAAYNYLLSQHQLLVNARSAELNKALASIEERLKQTDLPKEAQLYLTKIRSQLTRKVNLPKLQLARMMVIAWKFQRHLYDVYGGGHVEWQFAGPEATDATYHWLTLREKNGDFKISDPKLRSLFYAQWATETTTIDSNISITAEQEKETAQTRYELLNPIWLRSLFSLDINTQDN